MGFKKFFGKVVDKIEDTAEASARAAADTAEESRATTAEAGIASDLATHVAADGDLSDTNELQTLSETTPGVIALSGDGSVTVQDRVTGTCGAGSSIRVISATGTVTCEADTDTNTTYDGSDFWVSSQQTCAAGKVVTEIKADGTVTCAPDANTGFPSRYFVSGSKSIPAYSVDTFTLSCDAGDVVLTHEFSVGHWEVDIARVDMVGAPDEIIFQFANRDLSVAHTAYGTIACLDFGDAHT